MCMKRGGSAKQAVVQRSGTCWSLVPASLPPGAATGTWTHLSGLAATEPSVSSSAASRDAGAILRAAGTCIASVLDWFR